MDQRTTDRELLDGITSGSRAGFDRLYEIYFPRVYALAMRRLGSRPAAEQVTRRVFLDLVEALPETAGLPLARWILERTRTEIRRHGTWTRYL